MIRYFFDIITDGEVAPDEEGLFLPDIEAARCEASLSLTEIARDSFRSAKWAERMTVSVRTGDGPVCEAAFHWKSTALH